MPIQCVCEWIALFGYSLNEEITNFWQQSHNKVAPPPKMTCNTVYMIMMVNTWTTAAVKLLKSPNMVTQMYYSTITKIHDKRGFSPLFCPCKTRVHLTTCVYYWLQQQWKNMSKMVELSFGYNCLIYICLFYIIVI